MSQSSSVLARVGRGSSARVAPPARGGEPSGAGVGSPAEGVGVGPLNNIGPNNFAGQVKVVRRGIDTLTQSIELDGDTIEQFISDIGRFPLYQVLELRGYTFSVGAVKGPFNRRLNLGNGLALLLPAPKLVGRGFIQVHAGPEWLCARGEDELLPDMLAVVRELVGGVPGAATISRVDLCTDLRMSCEDWDRLHWAFVAGQRAGHLVHNGLQFDAYWDGSGAPSGVTVGRKAAGMLRIYDKGLEAAKGGDLDSWLNEWDLARIPDGEVVVRVEQQLRGDFLRNIESDGLSLVGVRTLEDVSAVASDLMRYLTAKWIRLAFPAMGHEHKRELLPLWSVVSSLLVDAWGSPCSPVKRVWRRGGASTVDRLSRMALGTSKTLAARLGYVKGYDGPMSLETVLRHLKTHEAAGADWLIGAQQRHGALVYGAVA